MESHKALRERTLSLVDRTLFTAPTPQPAATQDTVRGGSRQVCTLPRILQLIRRKIFLTLEQGTQGSQDGALDGPQQLSLPAAGLQPNTVCIFQQSLRPALMSQEH
jgi:hypothetical protein